MRTLDIALTVWLASLFVYTAGQKLVGYRSSIASVDRYGLLPGPVAMVGGALLPWAEFAVAGGLLVGSTHRLGGSLAAILGVCFLIASASAVGRGIVADCGCAGSRGTRIDKVTVGRAATIVASALVVALFGRGGIGGWWSLAILVLALVPAAGSVLERSRLRRQKLVSATSMQEEVARLRDVLQSSVSGGAAPFALPSVQRNS